MENTLIHLTEDNWNELVKDSDKRIMLYFGASWCPPCKATKPHVIQFAEDNADDIAVYYVDADSEQKIAELFNIMGIPAFILINKDKKTVGNWRGNSDYDHITTMTNQFFGMDSSANDNVDESTGQEPST